MTETSVRSAPTSKRHSQAEFPTSSQHDPTTVYVSSSTTNLPQENQQ